MASSEPSSPLPEASGPAHEESPGEGRGDVATSEGQPRFRAAWLLALAPAVAFVILDSALQALAGDVSAFGSTTAYRVTLNLVAVGRFAAMFAGVLFVWGLLRGRRAPTWVLVLAVLSGPLAYAISWFFRSQAFFPADQAAYYAVNPLVVGAISAQVGAACVAELIWRAWWRRHGGVPEPSPRLATWAVATLAVLGYLGMFAILLWDGGIHYFYWYQQVYKAIFMR